MGSEGSVRLFARIRATTDTSAVIDTTPTRRTARSSGAPRSASQFQATLLQNRATFTHVRVRSSPGSIALWRVAKRTAANRNRQMKRSRDNRWTAAPGVAAVVGIASCIGRSCSGLEAGGAGVGLSAWPRPSSRSPTSLDGRPDQYR
jgi:hypothetical protein